MPSNGTMPCVATLRLFASAREAAGTGRAVLPGDTVGELLAHAGEQYGPAFVQVLASCKVWVNGDAATDDTALTPADEVAVLPPVSGGAFDELAARPDRLTDGGQPTTTEEP
jgi:molybdopterin converting factor small subunit